MAQTQHTIADEINKAIAKCELLDTNQISDGYHTFGELYAHRIELYIALCRILATSDLRDNYYVWRSIPESGWFIMGVVLPGGAQISYHLPESMQDRVGFAEVRTTPVAFDGHTSDDVLIRLREIV